MPKLTKAHVSKRISKNECSLLSRQESISNNVYVVLQNTLLEKHGGLKNIQYILQLFSESAAAAMEFYSKQEMWKKLHPSAAAPDLTRRMNKLFDSLNCRRPEHVKYNEAEHIAVSDWHYYFINNSLVAYAEDIEFQTLKENIAWLDDWQKYIVWLPLQRSARFLC